MRLNEGNGNLQNAIWIVALPFGDKRYTKLQE
jgi:hypothetical protein